MRADGFPLNVSDFRRFRVLGGDILTARLKPSAFLILELLLPGRAEVFALPLLGLRLVFPPFDKTERLVFVPGSARAT